MVCQQSAKKISRRIPQGQGTDVITHGVVTVFIGGERVDVKRYIECRHSAVGKTVESVNNGEHQNVLREAVKIVGDTYGQDADRNERSRATTLISHSHRQARSESQGRTEGNKRADGGHRDTQVLKKGWDDRRCRIALHGYRNDGYQKFERAHLHIRSLIL